METENDLCWADQVGDRWEAEGTDPGRIFESGETLSADCFQGIMVETKEDQPVGVPPKTPTQVKRVLVVLKRGLNGGPEEVNLVSTTGYRPILVVNWHRIQPTLG